MEENTPSHITLEELNQKLDQIHESVEKTRKYFQIVLWVTIAMVLIPMIALMFIVPKFLSIYTTGIEGLL